MTDTINDTEVVYRCGHRNHPLGVHQHFRDAEGQVTYSDDLNYVSAHSERLPWLWSRDEQYPVREATYPDLPTEQRPHLLVPLPMQTAFPAL